MQNAINKIDKKQIIILYEQIVINLQKQIDKKGKRYYNCFTVREATVNFNINTRKKIWISLRMTDDTESRRKKNRKKSEKSVDKKKRVWYNNQAVTLKAVSEEQEDLKENQKKFLTNWKRCDIITKLTVG